MLVEIHVNFSPRLHFGDVEDTRQRLDLGHHWSVVALFHQVRRLLSNLLLLFHLFLGVIEAIITNAANS